VCHRGRVLLPFITTLDEHCAVSERSRFAHTHTGTRMRLVRKWHMQCVSFAGDIPVGAGHKTGSHALYDKTIGHCRQRLLRRRREGMRRTQRATESTLCLSHPECCDMIMCGPHTKRTPRTLTRLFQGTVPRTCRLGFALIRQAPSVCRVCETE
jgi:hypothetical protein